MPCILAGELDELVKQLNADLVQNYCIYNKKRLKIIIILVEFRLCNSLYV